MWAPAELTKSAATALKASRKVEQKYFVHPPPPPPLQGILCSEIFIGQRTTSDTTAECRSVTGSILARRIRRSLPHAAFQIFMAVLVILDLV